jgi:hypothetical protein|nr:MAG TPA: hypothetical protein [Caudoviricetes sp.]
MWSTKYYIPFKSVDENEYRIDIEQNSMTDAKELIGTSTSFIVNIDDDDFLYKPHKFSTATISVAGSDYLQSLFSESYQDFRVNLYKNDKLVWTGFISPETYSQNYSDDVFEFSIDAISALATLQYIDYSVINTETQITSIFSIIKKCIIESKGKFNNIYIPCTYESGNTNFLESLTISEQNFFDEQSEAMKLDEVLDEICKVLNWTVCDYNGDVQFIDIDYISKGFTKYLKYNADLSSFEIVDITNNVNVQDVQYWGNDNQLDILGGFNKVKVRTNNYNTTSQVPEDDFEKLDWFTGKKDTNYKNEYETKQYLKSQAYKFQRYHIVTGQPLNEEDNDNYDLFKVDPTKVLGGFAIKRCHWQLVNDKPNISEYNWDYMYQIRYISHYNRDGEDCTDEPLDFNNQIYIAKYAPVLQFNNKKSQLYKNGAFGVSFQSQFIQSYDMSLVRDYEYGYSEGRYFEPLAILRIGNWYYTQNGWMQIAKENFNPEQHTFKIQTWVEGNRYRKWYTVNDTKSLQQNYEGLKGMCIELPSGVELMGDFEFQLLADTWDMVANGLGVGAMFKDIKIDFYKNGNVDVDEKSKDNADNLYENIINSNYINALDDIDLKISTFNNDGMDYSKLIYNDKYLEDNLFSKLTNNNVRLEEHLIKRIISQYKQPRFKVKLSLKNDERLNPFGIIKDNNLQNKRFILQSAEIDFANESFNIVLNQIFDFVA